MLPWTLKVCLALELLVLLPLVSATLPARYKCIAWRLEYTVSDHSIGWLGRPSLRRKISHWARHNRSVCVPQHRKEKSVRGQCALPQRSAIQQCLHLPRQDCRAVVCVPGFRVELTDGSREDACVTRSHIRADTKHPMCRLGCTLLMLTEEVTVPVHSAAIAEACATTPAIILMAPQQGALWFDDLAHTARASLNVAPHPETASAFHSNAVNTTLFLF